MRHIKEFKDIDWEDWDDEEFEPNNIIYDINMLLYLYIMTGNSTISGTKIYIDKLSTSNLNGYSGMVYQIISGFIKQSKQLTIQDISWLNLVNDIVNVKNKGECHFHGRKYLHDNLEGDSYIHESIELETFNELYNKYYLMK